MMSLIFGLFTQVSGSGPLGPLVLFHNFNISFRNSFMYKSMHNIAKQLFSHKCWEKFIWVTFVATLSCSLSSRACITRPQFKGTKPHQGHYLSVCFVLCEHLYSLHGLIRRMVSPRFIDTVIRARWVWSSWSVGLEAILSNVAIHFYPKLDNMHVGVKLGIWKISRLLTVNLGIPSLIE